MRPELTQNLWERYGFRDNPFDTRALSMTPDSKLSVAQAFVEGKSRSKESDLVTNFLRSPGGGRLIVEGEVGVGKTTFVNYHRYLWESEAKTKLITTAMEISVHGDWGVREFLISILGSLAARLSINMKHKDVKNDQLLNEIFTLTSVLFKQSAGIGGGASILGSGGTVSKSSSMTVQLGEITSAKLRDYLIALMGKIGKQGFQGAILHLNNLEILARKDITNLKNFFDEVRDYLQLENLYFIFIGYIGMFQEVIVPNERVRSIFFGHPIILLPLALNEVKQAIHRRYQLLAINPESWIPPVDEQLVNYLYNTYSGKIRFIMDSITTLITNLPEGVTGTMNFENAQPFLKELVLQRIQSVLTPTETEVLLTAIQLKRFTNSSMVKRTKRSKQHINKFINRFQKYHFIYQSSHEGKSIYYDVSPDLLILE